jgi:glycosyltransferase involved in cell wall biosynthesis
VVGLLDADMSLCIIVPCYNEAKRLPVNQFASFMGNHPSIHFCFVDDGSNDNTYEIITDLCSKADTQAFPLRLTKNSGKAEAVRHGLLLAIDQKYDRIGYWDADLATPLSAVHDLNHILDTMPNIELVMGARVKLMGRKIIRHGFRHYAGRVFATVASNVLRLPVYDTQCGAKLLRVKEYTRLNFEKPFISRWIFDVELIANLLAYWKQESPNTDIQTRIYEYPLHEWTDIDGSKVRPKDVMKVGIELIKIMRADTSRFSKSQCPTASPSILPYPTEEAEREKAA